MLLLPRCRSGACQRLLFACSCSTCRYILCSAILCHTAAAPAPSRHCRACCGPLFTLTFFLTRVPTSFLPTQLLNSVPFLPRLNVRRVLPVVAPPARARQSVTTCYDATLSSSIIASSRHRGRHRRRTGVTVASTLVSGATAKRRGQPPTRRVGFPSWRQFGGARRAETTENGPHECLSWCANGNSAHVFQLNRIKQ